MATKQPNVWAADLVDVIDPQAEQTVARRGDGLGCGQRSVGCG